MKKKQTTTKRQTWTPAKRAAFAAKMKAAREAAAATKKPNTTTRKNPPSVNGEGMTFAEWKAAAGPKAPKGLEAVKAWKAGEDPTEYRAPTKATRNPPMLPFHVYAEDGFESSHKTEAAAKRAADRGARRRRMAYSVIRVSGGHGSEVYATDAKPKGTTKNAPPKLKLLGLTVRLDRDDQTFRVSAMTRGYGGPHEWTFPGHAQVSFAAVVREVSRHLSERAISFPANITRQNRWTPTADRRGWTWPKRLA